MVSGSNVLKFFMMVLGNTLGAETDVIERLKNRLPLHQVCKEEECDVIIAFVPIGSRAGTDIEAALQKNQRSNVLKFFMMLLGNTLGAETDVIKRLKNRLSLREVCKEEECDVIIAFVPIASRAGTDIEAALQKIQTSRPVLLVVLHHTFDTDYIAPDSKHAVNREGVLAVDLLFYEGIGLLRNLSNDEALKSITDYLKSKSTSGTDAPPSDPTNKSRTCPCWCYALITILFGFIVAGVILLLHYYFGKL